MPLAVAVAGSEAPVLPTVAPPASLQVIVEFVAPLS
jgi:hypothetical protein